MYESSGGLDVKLASYCCLNFGRLAIEVVGERCNALATFKAFSNSTRGYAGPSNHWPAKRHAGVNDNDARIVLDVGLCEWIKADRQSVGTAVDAAKIKSQNIAHADLTKTRDICKSTNLFDKQIEPVRLKFEFYKRVLRFEVQSQMI